MRIEIYNDGKQLQDIKEGKISIQPAYYAVSTTDGKQWQEPYITLGIGTDEYWHCIIKFKDKKEAKDFAKRVGNVSK